MLGFGRPPSLSYMFNWSNKSLPSFAAAAAHTKLDPEDCVDTDLDSRAADAAHVGRLSMKRIWNAANRRPVELVVHDRSARSGIGAAVFANPGSARTSHSACLCVGGWVCRV